MMKTNLFTQKALAILCFVAFYFLPTMSSVGQESSLFLQEDVKTQTEISLIKDEPTLDKIVGGSNANIQDYPWQVAIMTSNNQQFCGGSIVNEYWIVTAAHCLGSYSNIRIRAGVTNKTHTTGQTITVAQEISHPNYHAASHRNDIALLRLSSPLDLSGSNAKAIPIMTQAHATLGLQDPGIMATITGWGATSEGGSGANILQVAEVPVVSNADAMNLGGYNQGQITEDMICAGFLGQGGIDACQGDSGGPFVVPDADSPVGYRLAGATSWGYGCARPQYPGIYARVSHFQAWIEQVTGLSWEGPSGVANPTALNANASGQNQIALSWQKNSNNNNVMIAVSTNGTFGNPNNGTNYNTGNSIAGGGTVIYKGSANSFLHNNLSPATTYHYKVWSYDGGLAYSSGVESFATTQCGTLTLPYTENFTSSSAPACWKVTDNQGNGQVWQFGTFNDGLSGASGNYAYLNSDGYGSGNSQNSDLISPSFDFSAYSIVNLSFKHYFRQYQSVSSATLSYSIDNGISWQQVQQWTATTANPATFDMEIPGVAGQSNVLFKWNYTGTWGYYWSINDIEITGSADVQYNLTMSTQGQGSVTPQAGTHQFAEGSSVELSANAANNWRFVHWVLNGQNYTQNPISFNMSNDVSATAVFEEIPFYTLNVSKQGNGTTQPEAGSHSYIEGTELSLSANAGQGYEFYKWVVNGSDHTTSSVSLTMNQNISATAYFVEEEVPVDDCMISQLPYLQPFDATVTPDCWSVVDNQGNGQVWQFGTGGSMSGASGNYAFLNSDAYGNGNTQNADLVSPTYDLSNYETVNLSFKHYFRQYQSVSAATLYYSINNGQSWVQIQQWTANTANPATFDMEIGAVAGQSQVKFKWNYTGSWGYYWSIDDVQVSGTMGCVAVNDFPYTQDFTGTFAPECWDIQSLASNTWIQTAGYSIGTTQVNPVVGNRFAYVNWQAVNQDERLLTPVFDFSQLMTPKVSFAFNGSSHWSVDQGNCELMLVASVNGGSWNVLWSSNNHSQFASGSNYQWLNAEVDLSDYQGENNVRLAFRYSGNDGANFAIDNIVVDSPNKNRMINPFSADSKDGVSVQVFPVPAKDNLYVNLKGFEGSSELQVISVNGQVLKSLQIQDSANGVLNEINLDALNTGVYFVRIISNEAIRTVRFVKE